MVPQSFMIPYGCRFSNRFRLGRVNLKLHNKDEFISAYVLSKNFMEIYCIVRVKSHFSLISGSHFLVWRTRALILLSKFCLHRPSHTVRIEWRANTESTSMRQLCYGTVVSGRAKDPRIVLVCARFAETYVLESDCKTALQTKRPRILFRVSSCRGRDLCLIPGRPYLHSPPYRIPRAPNPPSTGKHCPVT